jgi:hypothetical protein
LLPPDNATGNFTKVVQRIPVKITLDDAGNVGRLRAGMSVEPTIDTKAAVVAAQARPGIVRVSARLPALAADDVATQLSDDGGFKSCTIVAAHGSRQTDGVQP